MYDEPEVMHRVSNMSPMWSSLVRYYKRTEEDYVGLIAKRLSMVYKKDLPNTDWLECSLILCNSGTE